MRSKFAPLIKYLFFMKTLLFKLVDSFRSTRNLPNGDTIQARRYVYEFVKGSSVNKELFIQDVRAKTCIGGLIHDNGKLLFYSWHRSLTPEVLLKRSDKRASWFLDTSAQDDLNALAETSPALVKALGPEIVEKLINLKPPVLDLEPEEEPEHEEPTDDGLE